MPKTARALQQLPPATQATLEKLGADLAVAPLKWMCARPLHWAAPAHGLPPKAG